MRIIETKAFQYDELSDAAKEKARDWYRSASAGDDFWSESVLEDDAEVNAELESLARKRAGGSLDDVIALPLWSALVNAGVLPQ